MNVIIKLLLLYISVQEKIIIYLMIKLFGKDAINIKSDKPVNKKYRKLQVDDMPIFEKIEKYDYKQLLEEYKIKHGKELKPVKHRKNSKNITPKNITCPCCNAPSTYIYNNSGGRGQYLCKVCKSTFNRKNRFCKSVILRCPHCLKTLEKVKERKDFFVYKCKNNECSFYKKNLGSMSDEDKKLYKKYPEKFKLRYIYRGFNFKFKPLSKSSSQLSKVDLSRIYASSHTLDLIFTYHVNYGLSARKTSAIMKDVHGLDISHQTVLNYANAASIVLKPFIDNFNYELSDSLCGDETYVKVNSKWRYLFLFFDATKKIILSYRISPNRDTLSAVKVLNGVLLKLKSIPEDLTFVVDGNPIYLLAQHYFAQHDIFFNVE